MSFEALFKPNGIAVVGSAGEGKLANILINRLLDAGSKKVFAVNPKSMNVKEAQGYSKLTDIPENIDMVIIASPASTVKAVMEEAGEKGVKAAVIITSGFGETGNKNGEKEVMQVAKKYGIRCIGPNCAGLANTYANLAATLETVPPKGSIAIVSQSGAIGGSFMAISADDGVGISKFVSYGNGADLSAIELIRYLKTDDETKVIALYLESVSDGREFMEAVKEVSAVKPVVIVKSGRTATGQRATLSHTGSMAGSDNIFDAALKQCGAIRVDTLSDLFELCKGFSLLPEAKGRELSVVTNSGGPGVMSTDRAETMKLNVSEPDEEIKSQLREFLPPHAGLRNPVDLTVEGTGEEYSKALEITLTKYDMAIAIYVGTPYLKAMPVAEGIVRAYKKAKKPVAAVLQVGIDLKESLDYLRENGVPCFSSGELAVTVLSKMADYEKQKSESDNAPCLTKIVSERKLFNDTNRLLEYEAMTMLSENGINPPPFRFSTSEEDAVKSANEIGFPIVMKVVSPLIIHKSDVGGVILKIQNDEEARIAFNRLYEVAKQNGNDFRGVIMYPMLKPGREVILGLTNDISFGPVIAFGMGGIYTEVLKDITFRIAPVSVKEAHKMIKEIKTYPVLSGVRGQKSVDMDELAKAISAFSELPFKYTDIAEGDLNPVFAYEDGVTVVDARILGK